MAVTENIAELATSSAVSSQRKPRAWMGQSLVMILMLIVLVYFLMPLFWLIVSTTKTNSDLFSTFGFWFSSNFNLFNNLSGVFSYDGGVFLTWLWNSTYYAVCSAVGAALFATMAGYVFAKFQFPGRTLVFAIILGAIMVPNTALAVPLYLLLSNVGLTNTALAVILPSMVTPFGVFLMRMYVDQAISDDLLDAARVDGAGELRIFWSIALRVLSPGLVTILLLSFVGTWNNYFLPLLVENDPSYYPLTVGLANWNQLAQSFTGSQVLFTLVITGSLISVIPLVIGFLFLQRYWQSGLTFGSLKG